MSEETICPGCGARPIEMDGYITTLHARDCSWMADPNAEPYDDHLTLVDLSEPPTDVVDS